MPLKDFNIDGKVAFVTGSGRGIGKAIALDLAEAGANVTLISRTKEQIEQTAEEVRQFGRQALAIPTDVSQEDQVKKAVEQTVLEFGTIDILVNCAGIPGETGAVALDPGEEASGKGWGDFDLRLFTLDDWQQVLSINLTSVFICCQAVGPHMIGQKSGKIINVASIYGYFGVPYAHAYCTVKAGMINFTRSLASELAQYNINVNAIAPGFIWTAMTQPDFSDPEFKKEYVECIPFKRLGEPEEVAPLALYLASNASTFMTGETIIIDGGQVARGNDNS